MYGSRSFVDESGRNAPEAQHLQAAAHAMAAEQMAAMRAAGFDLIQAETFLMAGVFAACAAARLRYGLDRRASPTPEAQQEPVACERCAEMDALEQEIMRPAPLTDEDERLVQESMQVLRKTIDLPVPHGVAERDLLRRVADFEDAVLLANVPDGETLPIRAERLRWLLAELRSLALRDPSPTLERPTKENA